MRILVISNDYPDQKARGYGCTFKAVVERLISNGHEVQVLTSRSVCIGSEAESVIHPLLAKKGCRHLDLFSTLRKEIINQNALSELCSTLVPDVILVWNLTHISASMANMALVMGIPCVSYITDNWLPTWKMDHWYQHWNGFPRSGKGPNRFLKLFSDRIGLSPPPDSLDHVHHVFSSRHTRDTAQKAGMNVDSSELVYCGIDTTWYTFNGAGKEGAKRLLFFGNTASDEELDTLFEAVSILNKHYNIPFSLTILGGNDQFDENLPNGCLSKLTETGKVRLLPRSEVEDLVKVYHDHDMFLSSSIWDERLSVPMLEAMSCGLAVVSTRVGANSEILETGVNSLTFGMEDPEDCAQQVMRLSADPDLFESIRRRGRETVEKLFDIEQTCCAIEAKLLEVSGKNPGCGLRRSVPSLQKTTLPSSWPAKAFMKISSALDRLDPSSAYMYFRGDGFRSCMIKVLAFLLNASLNRILPTLYKPVFMFSGDSRKPSEKSNILVVLLADIGDIVLTSPFLRELRKAYPTAWIGLVVQPWLKNLVEECPYVDEVFTFAYRGVKNWKFSYLGHPKWWIEATRFAYSHHFWKRRIDMAICPRIDFDSSRAATAILMYVTGAQSRIGYLYGSNEESWLVKFIVSPLYKFFTSGPKRGMVGYEVKNQLNVLRSLGIHPSDASLELWTSAEDNEFADGFVRTLNLSQNDLLIGFAPGAGWIGRRWPVENFMELGKWLHKAFEARIVILGGRQDQETGVEIERSLPQGIIHNLAGKLTLRQTGALIKKCRLLVANDSGPMHMAVAAKIPVIGIFGSGNPVRFRPKGAGNAMLRRELACFPCSEFCSFDKSLCIEVISVDQVKRAILNVVGGL